MLPITKPTFGKEERKAVNDVLKSGLITKGKKVEEVEEYFKKITNRKFAVMLTSGTVSLNTATSILDLKPGSEIITSAFTFIASATCVPYVGAKLTLADINLNTFNVDPSDLERRITKKTKAIIAVDLYGLPFDYSRIKRIAKKYNLYLVEDAAQAHGAKYYQNPAGSLGDISIFSFYGSKIITSGEGGMLLTDDKNLYQKALAYRNHGESADKKYFFTSLGYNFMPTDLQGALLLEQARKLEKFVKLRIKAADYYTKRLEKINWIICPNKIKGLRQSFSCYTIRVKNGSDYRDRFVNFLNKNKIGARVYYPIPLHLQPLWRKLGYSFKKGEYPNAETASQEVLSLPIFPNITTEEQDYVVKIIKRFKI